MENNYLERKSAYMVKGKGLGQEVSTQGTNILET